MLVSCARTSGCCLCLSDCVVATQLQCALLHWLRCSFRALHSFCCDLCQLEGLWTQRWLLPHGPEHVDLGAVLAASVEDERAAAEGHTHARGISARLGTARLHGNDGHSFCGGIGQRFLLHLVQEQIIQGWCRSWAPYARQGSEPAMVSHT